MLCKLNRDISLGNQDSLLCHRILFLPQFHHHSAVPWLHHHPSAVPRRHHHPSAVPWHHHHHCHLCYPRTAFHHSQGQTPQSHWYGQSQRSPMPPELYQPHMRSQGSEDYSNLGQNIQDPSYYDIQWKKLDSWSDEITFWTEHTNGPEKDCQKSHNHCLCIFFKI